MTSTPPLRMVALGDSLTEGLGDPCPDEDPGQDSGQDSDWRGWAALLADGLRPGGRAANAVDLRNLAVSGAQTADVLHRQLPPALAHRPQVAAVVVGGNDTLRAGYDIHAVARNLDATLGSLAGGGALLLTACLPDPGRMLGLPAPLARPLARRMRSVNEVVHVLSARYGAHHVHIAGSDWVHDPRMWSVDRLHPSERGHRVLAREFHALLRADGNALAPPPGAEPLGAPPTRGGQTWWMATRGTRWVLDRCTDLLPDLLRLAVAETRQRRRGETDLLDRRAAAETAAALRALPHAQQPDHQRLRAVG